MTGSYLLFRLSGRLFGVQLAGMVEIVPWRALRSVPLSYSHVEGLLDYRGVVYPVYNLAERLGFGNAVQLESAAGPAEQEKKNRSIILLEQKKLQFGIVTDSAVKMVRLEEQPAPPQKVQGIDPRYVKGYLYDEDHEIMVLDFERLFHAG
jgi:purine-binding chemotaxis protein CheW